MKKIFIIVDILIIFTILLFLSGCEGVLTVPELNIDEPISDSPVLINEGEVNTSENQENPENTVKDTTKPVIIATRSPLPNKYGWNNTDVKISFVCEDVGPNQSGIAVNTVQDITVTTEGANQSVTNTGTCIDAAGNVADPVTVTGINIDKTPPVIIVNLPKDGKYKLNENIEITLSVEDELSGIAEEEIPKALKKVKVNTKSIGAKKITIAAGLFKDRAGNLSKEVIIPYEVVEEKPTPADTTKPVIIATRSPLPNKYGWNNTDVKISFVCEDVGPNQSGIAVNTVQDITVTTEGANQSVTNTGTCIDAAGNVADPVTVTGINIDKTPPVITLTLPGNGEYKQNEYVQATWSASDSLSGVISPSSGKITLDTSSTGINTITLSAGKVKDKAGNSSASMTKTYSVITNGTENPIVPPPPNTGSTVYPQTWATGTGTKDDPWANNCVQKAVNQCPVGGTVYLKAGYYRLSDCLWFGAKSINLVGEGMGKTIVKTANTYGISIQGVKNIIIKNMTIDGAAQPANTRDMFCLKVSLSEYVTVENIEVMNAGWTGLEVFSAKHILVQNVDAHDCDHHGIHTGTPAGSRGSYMYNIFNDIRAWNNGDDGFNDAGDQIYTADAMYNKYSNIECWGNGASGVSITDQSAATIFNMICNNNGERGFNIRQISESQFDNLYASGNKEYGLLLVECYNITVNSAILKNNNIWGIYVYNNSKKIGDVTLTSCQSYDDRVPKVQSYGLALFGSKLDKITLSNCTLTPNKIGEIYNRDGTVIIRK